MDLGIDYIDWNGIDQEFLRFRVDELNDVRMDQILPDLDQILPDLDQILPDLDQIEPDLDQIEPYLDQIEKDLDQIKQDWTRLTYLTKILTDFGNGRKESKLHEKNFTKFIQC